MISSLSTCCMCADDLATFCCSCTGDAVLFCSICAPFHTTQDSEVIHELTAVQESTDNPIGVEARVAQGVKRLRTNISQLKEWKTELVAIVEQTLTKLIDFRDAIKAEVRALSQEIESALIDALKEIAEQRTAAEPYFTSPVSKALWSYKSGTEIALFSCQTNFDKVRQSAEAFVCSLSLQLQTEMVGFNPTGLVKYKSDINPDRRVHIYQALISDFHSFFTAASIQKFSDLYLPLESPTPKLRRGPIILPDESLYIGDWGPNGEMTGCGKLLRASGSVYLGDFINDKYSGKGIYIWEDGCAYEGEFVNGKRHGFGKRSYSRGYVYTGQWEYGLWNGLGSYLYDFGGNFQGYIGQFVADWKEGRGMEFVRDEYIYAGEFKGGKRKGVMYQNGEMHYGEFRKDGTILS